MSEEIVAVTRFAESSINIDTSRTCFSQIPLVESFSLLFFDFGLLPIAFTAMFCLVSLSEIFIDCISPLSVLRRVCGLLWSEESALS